VKYAKDEGVGVAVRTGGHQYSGACSTSGDNIQLDLSDTFQSEEDFKYDSSTNNLHIGISFSLLEMNNRLRERSLFLPHGQCVHVHVGGHVQTGGYGQLSRGFGLLCDHMIGFDIVLASGDHVTIWKPDGDITHKHATPKQKQSNDDLYWAVLGGSPGNYGILTHVYLKPLNDKDYPDSRGMKLFTLYTKEKLEKILTVTAEMNDDKELARDFDICVTVMSDSSNGWFFRSSLPWKPKKFDNLDEEMLVEHAEEFADGVDYAEQGKMSLPMRPMPAILVYLQWANVQGSKEKFGDKEKIWFDKIRNAASPNIMDKAFDEVYDGIFSPITKVLKAVIGRKEINNWMHVSEEKHMPMSKLTRYWCYEDIREFVKPYEKRTYFSNRHDLSTNGWLTWVSGRINQIVEGDDKDIDLTVQIQLFGGNKSMYHVNGRPELNNGCHSWREETSMMTVLDVFYQPENDHELLDGRLHQVLQWQAENDTSAEKGGIFCNEDRRVLWGTYSRRGDPDVGTNLYSVRDKYFDSEEKYTKLVAIKNKVDPEYVFTANTFGVDANNAPENRQMKILGRGYYLEESARSDPAKGAAATSASRMPRRKSKRRNDNEDACPRSGQKNRKIK